MNQQQIFLLIIGGVLLAFGGIFTGIQYAKKKGWDVEKGLNEAETVLQEVKQAIVVGKEVAPGNKIIEIGDEIIKWAEIGVQSAEQEYHAGELTSNEDRKKAALDTVYAALNSLNVTPSDNEKILIESCINGFVNKLGHKDKTEAEKEAEKQELREANNKLVKENGNLKEVITSIQCQSSKVAEATA